MKIQRFETPGLAQYAYLISCGSKAAVIDPMRDIDVYLAYVAEQGLTITHVLETHIHADFASGAVALAEETGAELALSAYDEGEHYEYAMPHRALRNGNRIHVGNVIIEPLHTPGHTPEHLSFVAFDTLRGAREPVALFSGDFLFVGSLGRPDLLGEAAKRGLAQDLYTSLHERIAHLPDGVQVFPGHGAGSLCGSGMSDRPESTLGYERATNPLFKLSREAFVAEVLGSVPPMPTYYPRMKSLNSEGALPLGRLPPATAFTPGQVRALEPNTHTLLDLRHPESFGGAHIPGTINIGAGATLPLWAGWLLDPQKPILLIAEAGADEEARRALARVGLDNVVGFLAGGMPSWIDAGFEIASVRQLSPEQVHHSGPEAQLVDVRTAKEWQAGRIGGAIHIPLEELERRSSELAGERPLTAICGTGYRSSIAASLLERAGFRQVGSMAGGMAAWNARGLPNIV